MMKTYIVAHPKLYVKAEVNGKTKMVKLELGTEYECEEKHAKSLLKRGKLVVAKAPKKVKAVIKN